jgi:glycosyltransferase involved in cell wall biosynthesis
MRFSVLLPTRNGGAYLENCLRSVLEQNHSDFELVVSDNANSDSTPNILRAFAGDTRLRVLRQEQLLPVHENWTATVENSSGNYLLMMGDDDYLLPGTLARLDETLKHHEDPDCILFNGYSFVTPDVIDGSSSSYWAPYHFNYGRELSAEGVIECNERLSIVRDMFKFRQRIPLNMQTTLFSRSAAAAVPGGVFQPPFPDHFLLNALLISAKKWVFLPDRLVIVGMSPKSFGHFFYTQQSSNGLQYLGISTDFSSALPGNELLNGMCVWLSHLKEIYGSELVGIDVDRAGYLIRQMYYWLSQYIYSVTPWNQFVQRIRLLSFGDWISVMGAAARPQTFQRMVRILSARRKTHAELLWHNLSPLSGPRDIHEFAQWLQRNHVA